MWYHHVRMRGSYAMFTCELHILAGSCQYVMFTCDFVLCSHVNISVSVCEVDMLCSHVVIIFDVDMWCSHVFICDVHMWFSLIIITYVITCEHFWSSHVIFLHVCDVHMWTFTLWCSFTCEHFFRCDDSKSDDACITMYRLVYLLMYPFLTNHADRSRSVYRFPDLISGSGPLR